MQPTNGGEKETDYDDNYYFHQNQSILREQESRCNSYVSQQHRQKNRYRSRSPHSSGSNSERYMTDEQREDYCRGVGLYRRNTRSVFERLGGFTSMQNTYNTSAPRHGSSDEKSQYTKRTEDENARRMNMVVNYTDEDDHPRSLCDNQADIISAIQTLEIEQQKLKNHCNGLRDTIESYFREISKLEALVLIQSQELECLKRRLKYV